MTRDQVAQRFPEEIARKEREGLYHYRPFGGENWSDIELRIHSFLGTLNRDCEGSNVLVVCHGHWLILFQRLLEHFSIEEAMHRYKEGAAENASVTIYEADNGSGHSRLVLKENNVVPWRGKIL
jgi:probable phosphoglycerate mutase